MDAPRRTQVAVVGASPSGLVAAERAAREGADVLLVEAGRVGHPEPPAVVGFDHVWPNTVDPPGAAIRGRFHGVELTSPGGHTLTVQAPGRIVDRTVLDEWLAERAREAGADVETEAGPWQVDGPGRLVQADRALEADVVVFADGARSIAREIVDPVQEPDQLVWGVTHEIPVRSSPDRLPIRVGDHAPGGRTQTVPIDDETTWHWTFARRPRRETIEIAERSVRAEADRRGWSNATVESIERRHVAPDPVFQRPGTLAADRTLVAGGAAGLGGLEVGLAAGSIAGRVAAQAAVGGRAGRADLVEHERICHERFSPAYRGLADLMTVAERVPDGLIDALAAPWDGQRVDLDRVAGLALDDLRSRARSLAGIAVRSPGRATRSLVGGLLVGGASIT